MQETTTDAHVGDLTQEHAATISPLSAILESCHLDYDEGRSEEALKRFHRFLWKDVGDARSLSDGTREDYVGLGDDLDGWRILKLLRGLTRSGAITSGLQLTFILRKPQFDYQEYLQSDEWKSTRDAARERAGYRCQVCNTDGPILDTHHRTYERIGDELPGDLIVLCRDCHDAFHEHRKLARPQ